VHKLRAWMDDPRPRGLPEEVQNLVILTWAEQQQLAFMLHGGPQTPSLESMRDELELKAQKLPDREHWQVAVRRAQDIFGLGASELLNASNVSRLVADVRTKAQSWRADAHAIVERLSRVQRDFGLDPGGTRRMRTARSAEALVEAVLGSEQEKVVEALATGIVETSEAAMAMSLSRGAGLVSALESTAWDLFEAVGRLADDRAEAARLLRNRVAEALEADELAVNLAMTLRSAQADAVRLLAPPDGGIPPKPIGWREVQSRTRLSAHEAITQLQTYLASVEDARRDRLAVSWRVEEKE
jgi:hypothetical protein